MPGVQYQHIGHNPTAGRLALWTIDPAWRLHVSERAEAEPDAAWLDWSHQNCFPGVSNIALGRTEIERRAGSIHFSDRALSMREEHLLRVLSILDRRFPDTRWYLFGPGFRGQSVSEHLSGSAHAA